ncbi:MAG: T9SS type A sorting domain-containing protein [Flavobacteriaceae bacterium]|jgi:hypothetical protein|nr:T9SS type A sorting domain-containing protein [Flavobacteriaceae bacterium]
MKQTYFILFIISTFSFAGFSQSFQIELVDETIGTSLTSPPGFYTNESNDAGLNQIFENHNVIAYEAFSPNYPLPFPYNAINLFNIVECNSCNTAQFLADLNAYTSVVRYASVDVIEGIINNALSVYLLDNNVGMPIGDNNGIIVTNDNGLNQIFQDYNVRAFELLDGISLPDYYGLVCSCDATQLKLELDNYNSVISSSEYATTTFLLSIKNTDIQEVTIYPNPFQNSIDISNSNLVEKFQLFDILGKRLFNSKEKAAFVDFSETLKGGIYILKLSDYEGNSILKKLIKN